MPSLQSDSSLEGAVLEAVRKYANNTAYSEADRWPLMHVDKLYMEAESTQSPQEFLEKCLYAVLAHNNEGKLVVASKGAGTLFGYSADELKKMYSIQIVPEHRMDERKQIIARAMSGALVVADTERYCRMIGGGLSPDAKVDTRLINVRVHVFPYEHEGMRSIAAVAIPLSS